MTANSISKYREEYIVRINKVLDYIEQNLAGPLLLEDLAKQAHFSKYHFHRIFSAMINETVSQFILRLRLEKAARELIMYRKKSITEICFDCGFSSSAIFSRNFRSKYKVSPSAWRNGGFKEYHKKHQANSKNYQIYRKKWKEFQLPQFYIDPRTNNQVWRIPMDTKNVTVEVKELPEMQVAYIRHTGPYKGDVELFQNLFTKLLNWAGPRNLLQSPDTTIMTVYHDDPEITAAEKLRLSVCVTIPENMPVDGAFGKMTLPKGRFAVGSFELSDSSEFEQAWSFMFGAWLPDSGFQPDDGLSYEMYKNDPEKHEKGIHLVDICIPIKPL